MISLPRYISHHGPPAHYQPNLIQDGDTLKTTVFFVEERRPVIAVYVGALTPAPGSSSLLMFGEVLMSPGLQIQTLAHSSWEGQATRDSGREYMTVGARIRHL